MATYVIADLHLSEAVGCNKSMEIFGRRWTGYTEKIRKNWEALIKDEDTVIIPGDISWALDLSEAEADLRFVDSLPGTKYLGKGNHDLWWSSMTKNLATCEKWGLSTLRFLFNNAYETDDFILAGSRGWFFDDAAGIPDGVDFDKIVAREAGRLRMSLTAARACAGYAKKETLAFMHFPPVWNGREVAPIVDTLAEFGVSRCFVGHIHGNYTVRPNVEYRGIEFTLVSADYLDFVPHVIHPISLF